MARPLRPVFTFDLNSRVLPGRITVGCYDGQRPCLTVATPADKVLVHWPRGTTNTVVPGRLVCSETNREVATLNVGEPIEALLATCLLPSDEKDVLCIGTTTHILVYHVYDNRDVFRRECPDGAYTLATNSTRSTRTPVLLIGGESAVRGLDHTGAEIFWIAVGDHVSAILLLGKQTDNPHDPSDDELVIGSTDRCIRVYQKGQLSVEHAETEAVVALAALSGDHTGRFAYALRNGTVGVYERGVRLWRVKSRGAPICLCVPAAQHLLAGWASGRVDWRRADTGELMLRDTLSHSAAGIVLANYRATASVTNTRMDIICVTINGEVRGYDLDAASSPEVNITHPERDVIRELLSQKQSLLLELAHYESNTRHNDALSGLTDRPTDSSNVGVIPASTRLHVGLSTDTKSRSVQLFVSTTGDNTMIRAVVVFAEGLFASEATIAHPIKASPSIRVALRPPTDNPVDLHVKALVGRPDATLFHVFELTRQLPRFAMYTRLNNNSDPLESCVKFRVNDRVQRVCMWINQNFLLDEDVEPTPGAEEETRVTLKCLRDDTLLRICIHASGAVKVCSEHLRVAADVVRSLAGFLNVEKLSSLAVFPEEEARVRRLMGVLPEVQGARTRLAADTAERLTQVRALVIRAEDSRINSIDEMWRHYVQLQRLNEDLAGGHEARLRNHAEGAAAVKDINDIIQQASRLRVGAPASEVVNLCRSAIRTNNVEALIQAIRTGGQ